MNNEEKIFEMLTQIQSDISGMKSDINGMKFDIADLKKGQDKLEQKMDRLDSRVASLETDVRETKHTVSGIDLNTRRIWAHLIEHSEAIKELKEM